LTEKQHEAVLYVLLTFLLLPPLMMFDAYAFVKLWSWFVVPLFPVSPLRMLPAMGLMMAISYATKTSPPPDERSYREKFASALSLSLAKPALALLVGAWIHRLAS
jgi:hypothetical protein